MKSYLQMKITQKNSDLSQLRKYRIENKHTFSTLNTEKNKHMDFNQFTQVHQIDTSKNQSKHLRVCVKNQCALHNKDISMHTKTN